MLDYIWFNDKSPLLNQLPEHFNSAAFILHPFPQMPLGWQASKRKYLHEHIYPTDEELLSQGIPVSWETVKQGTGMATLEEVALALMTSIGALREKYAREDLAERLNSFLNKDLFYPDEDITSMFIVERLLNVLRSKGAKNLNFSDPINDKKGTLDISTISPQVLRGITWNEIIVTDENQDFAFMNFYDSFTTILMAKDDNIEKIVESLNSEAIICDEKTYINWYLVELLRKRKS